MKMSHRLLKRIIKQERENILSEMRDNPARSLGRLFDQLGIDYEQSGEEFYIMTGDSEGVTITVSRQGR